MAEGAPRILLRSSWQSVNIGDIGHTPGALDILWKYIPQAQITLWPGRLGHGSRELLLRAFPQLKIAEGSVDAQGKPTTPELARAWRRLREESMRVADATNFQTLVDEAGQRDRMYYI